MAAGVAGSLAPYVGAGSANLIGQGATIGVGIGADVIAGSIGEAVDGAPPLGNSASDARQSAAATVADESLIGRVTDLSSTLDVTRNTNISTLTGLQRAIVGASKAEAIRRAPSLSYNRTMLAANVGISVIGSIAASEVWREFIEPHICSSCN
jgi:hypothetical protein